MSTTKLPFYSKVLNDSYLDGVNEGVEQGRAEGVEQGRAEGAAQSLLTVLTARSVVVPERAREAILATTDVDLLETWLNRALTATTLDDVIG